MKSVPWWMEADRAGGFGRALLGGPQLQERPLTVLLVRALAHRCQGVLGDVVRLLLGADRHLRLGRVVVAPDQVHRRQLQGQPARGALDVEADLALVPRLDLQLARAGRAVGQRDVTVTPLEQDVLLGEDLVRLRVVEVLDRVARRLVHHGRRRPRPAATSTQRPRPPPPPGPPPPPRGAPPTGRPRQRPGGQRQQARTDKPLPPRPCRK